MSEKPFNIMLAPNKLVEPEDISYPVIVSMKLDGIRCYFKDGQMLSRSNKPIRNKQLQEKFRKIIEATDMLDIIFDGEIYCHGMSFQEITSIVMSSDKEVPEELRFHCFDCMSILKLDEPFTKRISYLNEYYSEPLKDSNAAIVQQLNCKSAENLHNLFELALKNGYEGLIVRDPNGKYKCGRGTIKEGIIYKMKPYRDFDGKIIGVEERMENMSESYTNEMGHSQKHRYKDSMVPTGIASAFIVETEDFGVQKVSLTGIESFRKEIWEQRESMVNRWIKFKGMTVGSKDKIRHPVFLDFRDDK